MRHLRSALFLALPLLLGALAAAPAEASHFRYGNVSYRTVSGNTVEFKIQQAWRYSAFNTPVGGTTFTTSFFRFGDGSAQVPVQLRVTAVDTQADWLFGEMTVRYTYPGTGPYTAYFDSCCRISLGNGGGSFNLRTLVTPGNNSPTVALQPIVNLEENTPAARFTVPVSDSDGLGTIRFRAATSADLGGGVSPLSGFSVDATTGEVTMNTTGLARRLYGAGVVVEEVTGSNQVISRSTVDFLINVIPKTSNVAPAFDYAVTPAAGSAIQVRPGQPVVFDVRATDADLGDNIRLSAAGLPPNASLSPGLPASGNPVASRFTWTPTTAELGTSVVQFTAQDNIGVQTSTAVTIQVSQAPEFVGATPADNARIDVEPGQSVSFPVEIADADPDDQVRFLQVNGLPAGASFGSLPSAFGNPVARTFSWTPTAADAGPTLIEFVADDLNGDRSTRRITVFVNARPVLATNAGLTLVELTTEPITTAELEVTDADHGPADLTFALVTYPTEGQLALGGTGLGTGSTFTQADIDAGLLTYEAGHVHDGASDAFDAMVTDGAGAQLGPVTFTFTILPANRPPVADGGPDQTLEATDPAGTPVTLTSGSTDPDGDDLKLHWIRVLTDGTEEHLAHGAEVTLAFPVGTHTLIHRAEELTSGGVPVGTGTGHGSGAGLTDDDEVVVTIVDTTAPALALVGADALTLECPATFEDPGTTVSDNGDAAPTVSVAGTVGSGLGTYTLTYTATDAFGNTSGALVRTVDVVDTTAPLVTVLGAAAVEHVRFSGAFADPGATADDACDGALATTVSGTVDTTVPGSYVLTYSTTDASGNAASATRTVTVVDDAAAVASAYLILAERDVKIDGQVRTEGAVHSNDKLELKKGLRGAEGPSLHVGDLTSADDLKVHDDQRVDGDVTAPDVDIKRDAVVTGTVTEAAVARVELPAVSVLAGGADVRVADRATQALAPGSYGKLRVGRDAVLTLASGAYAFEEIKVEQGGRIEAVLATGPVMVEVEDKFEVKKGGAVSPMPFGEADARYLTFRVADGHVEFEDGTAVAAQIVAPESHVRLKKGARFVGVLVGEKVDLDDGVTALFATALSAVPEAAMLAGNAADGELATDAATESADGPTEADERETAATPEAAVAPTAAATVAAPEALTLGTAYPNPARDRATLRLGLPEAGPLSVVVYDVRGREVAATRGTAEAGWHASTLDVAALPSGVYVVRVTAGTEVATTRLTVVR
ncbi:immunoglobulin-like domain-containing protein [Rubrivirga sp. IMCC45206]|uniref:immunoglobulin-like domain-containing protein n=1 Tax=Rubrivirga sp. IMCC45206 TaxID=3391614 RepID=UPI0039903A57